MIFVTVGTQLPFDRLIKAVDQLADTLDGEEIIAQTMKGSYMAHNIKCVDYISHNEYEEYFKRARLVVAHAGTGTVLTAIKYFKPLIIVPRYAYLGEHRNDHQLATAMAFDRLGIVNVAYDDVQLKDLLVSKSVILPRVGNDMRVSSELVASLKEFLG